MSVKFQRADLDNGLTIVAETDPDAYTAAVGFFVKTGARDEASEVMGVSHFLEHMMFKGTARRSANDVNREFDELGARYNAYTSSEMTVFHAQVLPERLDAAVDLLADMLRPALREEDFTTEKNVILEEIAMYMDQPFWVLYENVIEKRYGDHAMAHRVLGTKETITALTAEQMRTYFNDRYSADNTTVALAGKLDFDKTVEQIASLCSGWERTGAARDTSLPPANKGSFIDHDDTVHRCYQMMLCPAPGADDDRRYAATMLALALGGPDNSLLHWSIIEPGLADEAQISYDGHDHAGDFTVYTSCDPERADEVWSIIEGVLGSASDSITEDDLDRLRNKIATGVTIAGERPGGRMQRLGRMWTYQGEYKSLEDELDAVNAVTLADIRSLCEEFPFEPRTFGRLLPGP